jgi:DnaK suppressor protein
MHRRELEYFRRLLTEWLDALSEDASRTTSSMTKREMGPGDVSDQAATESDTNFLLRRQDRESKLAGKIQEALGRIDDGTYGICEDCGKEISKQRLKARPVTTLCIDCKTLQEEEEHCRGE